MTIGSEGERGGCPSLASARSASSCASAPRPRRVVGKHYEQIHGWVRESAQTSAQRLATTRGGRRRARVQHADLRGRSIEAHRQRRVRVVDGCEGSIQHLDRALGLIALVIRARQSSAGANPHAPIIAGHSECLLAVRDRVRLRCAPLRNAEREQQRRALSLPRWLVEGAPNVARGDVGRAPLECLTRRAPSRCTTQRSPACPHASKCPATRAIAGFGRILAVPFTQ
jgi:hypothetical protein